MRSPPTDLAPERLREELADGWHIRAASLEYVPEGGGSHHWRLVDDDDRSHFVTVDDLDDKEWLGSTRESVFDGLRGALGVADALRNEVGLDFVVAPVTADDGELLHRLADRYTVSLFPFLAGRAYPFGEYSDPGLTGVCLDMLADLHRSTSAVRDRAPVHELGYGGERDLRAFLEDPGRPWHGGPYAEPARVLMAAHASDVTELVRRFDRLVQRTAGARAGVVITHGEPHPANLMSVDGRVVLIDWDTAALAPPERDLSLVLHEPGRDVEHYQRVTGHEVDFAVITLYRARWYLDDLASAVRMFRHPHREDADTRRWWEGVAPRLDLLPAWLEILG